MNIQNIYSLPSDPDITVMYVKRKLDETKAGDTKHMNDNFSLRNFLTDTENNSFLGSDDESFYTETSYTLSMQQNVQAENDSITRSDISTKTVSPSQSEQSIVEIKTIQRLYSNSNLETTPNCDIFDEIDLHVLTSEHLEPPMLNATEKRKRSAFRSVISSCFPYLSRKSK